MLPDSPSWSGRCDEKDTLQHDRSQRPLWLKRSKVDEVVIPGGWGLNARAVDRSRAMMFFRGTAAARLQVGLLFSMGCLWANIFRIQRL